jgi:hypothetical protein
MGWNPMNALAAPCVAQAAYHSTLESLRRIDVAESVKLLVGA